MTRSFREGYIDRDIWDSFALAKELVRQIDDSLANEELSKENIKFLLESKKYIDNVLEQYKDAFKSIRKIEGEQIAFGFEVMNNDPKYNNLSNEEKLKVYNNSSDTFKSIKKDFVKVFEIEDVIHDLITIPIWKKQITSVDSEIKPGDNFSYIVHSGKGIINLPGIPNYRKTRNFDGDYVSASLLSNQQMAMFDGSKVGLILDPNEAIVCSTCLDSGSHFVSEKNVRTVIKFKDGLYLETGFPGEYLKNKTWTTTKIQTPRQLTEDTVRRQKEIGITFSDRSEDVNEVVLDDSKIKVVGVFFKTNGCEINLKDFARAVEMEKLYNVPLKIVNSSIYRENLDLEKYKPEDLQKFEKEIEYWNNPKSLENEIDNPEEDRNLIKRYYNEVVIKQQFEPEIRKRINDTFTKMIEYTYHRDSNGKQVNAKKIPSLDDD